MYILYVCVLYKIVYYMFIVPGMYCVGNRRVSGVLLPHSMTPAPLERENPLRVQRFTLSLIVPATAAAAPCSVCSRNRRRTPLYKMVCTRHCCDA